MLKFYSFQIGCFYSRLLFLMEKYEVGLKYHKFVIDPWRNICDKLRRMQADENCVMINKRDFYTFSIRWLFQFADTLIKTENFEEIGEIYNEIDLLLANDFPDKICIKQTLFCRKENLQFLLNNNEKHKEVQNKPSTLNFADFLKWRKENGKSDPSSTKTVKVKMDTGAVPKVRKPKSPDMGPAASSTIIFKKSPSEIKKTKDLSPPEASAIYVDDDDDKSVKNKFSRLRRPAADLQTPVTTTSSKSSSTKSTKSRVVTATPKTTKEPATKRNLRQ